MTDHSPEPHQTPPEPKIPYLPPKHDKSPTRRHHDRIWAIVIGVGIALSPVHNQWLTSLATNAKGETLFFLPSFGYLITIMGTVMFLTYNWERVREKGWGDRRVLACLIVIALAIAASGATQVEWKDRVAPLGMAAVLVCLYYTARFLGKDILLPLAVGAAVASLGVFVAAAMRPGELTGGIAFEENYDVVAGYILLGAAMFTHRYRWVLAGMSLTAMLLTGSPEGIFCLAVAGAAIVIRKDWGWKLVYVMAFAAMVMIPYFALGYGGQLYSYAFHIWDKDITAVSPVAPPDYSKGDVRTMTGTGSRPPEYPDGGRPALRYRLWVIRSEMSHIAPLGTGYSITDFNNKEMYGRTVRIVHNVPLVLVQQLGYPGIMAALAWLFVCVYCLVRTRWKYAWVMVLSLSVFDHFIWTQMAPYWWVLVGVSVSADEGKTEDGYLFRERRTVEDTTDRVRELRERYQRIVQNMRAGIL